MDTNAEEEKEFARAREEMKSLMRDVRSFMLATVSGKGAPLSSYAPVFVDDHRCFYVYVSGIAKHYGHLRKSGVASVSLIEDESRSEELFARKRLTVDCSAELIERESRVWNGRIDAMVQRHGDTMDYLRALTDFDLFKLTPSEGRLVLGFGKAYRIFGDGLSDISYLGSGGHRSKS